MEKENGIIDRKGGAVNFLGQSRQKSAGVRTYDKRKDLMKVRLVNNKSFLRYQYTIIVAKGRKA